MITLDARLNPFSESAEYHHFRVRDPKLFRPGTFRTVTIPGHYGHMKAVMGKLKGKRSMTIQKLMVEKSAIPDRDRAAVFARDVEGGIIYENPGGDIGEKDKEMPLIYGRLLKITCVKTNGKHKGQKFFNEFDESTRCYGLPDGTVITLPSGRQITLENRCTINISDKGLWGEYT